MTATDKIGSLLVTMLEPLPTERAEAIYNDVMHSITQLGGEEAMEMLVKALRDIINYKEI